MKNGKIGVTTENIFPVIKKFLYSDHEIFLRELISNAVDATQKLKTLSSMGEAKGELGDLAIRVAADKERKTLTVTDRGVGMTAEEVDKYINQIAFSGAEEFMAKYKDQAIIGHFGLGFYSSFMVADKVEIITRSYKEGSKTVHWECNGSPEFSMEESDEAHDRGTTIVLHLSEEAKEYAEAAKIEELLRKYCRFLPVPIAFGKVKEWKDGKYVDTDKDNIINNVDPLWTRKPADITEEQYKEFYRELYPMSDEPLFSIHLNIDYPFHLTGILYFPKIHNNIEIQKNKIQLYSNQVYVTDQVEGIVPEYLTLLHGVIDSPDIPLNVSRSYLQSDANVKKISSYITRKVADRLQELFNTMRADYEAKWDDLKIFIEYGILTDEKFSEKAQEELKVFERAVHDVLDLTMTSFKNGDLNLARQVEPLEEVIDGLSLDVKQRHVRRLRKGKCTIELGFILSDVITNFERVSDHCSNIAGCVIDTAQHNLNLHESLRATRLESSDFIREFNRYAHKYALPASATVTD